MAAIEFTSTTKVNAIVWITSLAEHEKGVTRRVTEDLKDWCAREGDVPFELHEPKSSQELVLLLDRLAKFATSNGGWNPMIHLDTHGLADRGIKIDTTGEFVDWPTLADRFRAINIASGNNLVVVSHACFSLNVIRQIDLKKPTPFFMLFAPEGEIAAGVIEENTVGFYKDILTGHDVVEAREHWFPGDWVMFHCQRFMAILLARMIDTELIGRRAQRRKEELVSKGLAAGYPNNRETRRRLRAQANALIKPNDKLLKRTTGVFLMGQDPGFGIQDLHEIVMNARKEGRYLVPSKYDSQSR